MKRTATYSDFRLTDYFNIEEIRRSILPPREIGLLTIPGRHGAYFTGVRYGVRKIEMDVNVVAKTATDYMNTIRFLAFCLDVDEPSELLISDEPNFEQYAILANDTDMNNKLMKMGEGTLTFLCPDPFKYSTNLKTFNPTNRMFTLINDGTTSTFPKFTVNFTQDANFVSITSPEGVILIGNPSEVDQITLPKTEIILNDNMMSLSGWSNVAGGLDDKRVAAGTVVVDGNAIKASDYGTGVAGQWHGPPIRKDLPQELQDFELQFVATFRSEDYNNQTLDGNQMGMLEIYLFDKNGVKIGKMSMRDSYRFYEYNIPQIEIGNTVVLVNDPGQPEHKTISQKKKDSKGKTYTETKTVYPSHVGVYNDFFGRFLFRRVGTAFYAEVSKWNYDESKWDHFFWKTTYDRAMKFPQNKLSYVVIHFAQFETYTPVLRNRAEELKVIKFNTITEIDNPSIFKAGDVLEIDLSNDKVLLNGDPFAIMDDIDPGSTFFPLQEGTTQIKVNTDDPGATFSAEFTERYL